MSDQTMIARAERLTDNGDWRASLRSFHARNAAYLVVAQLFGTIVGLVFLPSNAAKAVVLPLWWLLTFGPMKKIEIVEFCLACLIFTGMNALALRRGIFAFTYPDVLGMPWFELFMWGFYLVHTRRALARVAAPRLNRCGAAVGLAVCFAIVFSTATGDVSRLIGPLAVILVSLAFFRDVSDFAHMGYMVFMGALIEYAGIVSGQWTYPSSQLAGVPLWFVTMWAGVGLYAHRIFLPKTNVTNTPSHGMDRQRGAWHMRTRRPISINNSLAHGICNYSCRICSVNKPEYCGPKSFQPKEITESLIGRIREAAAAGVPVRYVANAGDGEPTLHPDFVERMGMFGRMLKEWNAPVAPPEVSVVTNGSRLTRPRILNAIADNGLSLIVSFPTPDPEAYGTVMVGEPLRGQKLLDQALPGIEAAMEKAAKGELSKLYFHVSPPEREIVRRDFDKTIAFLTERAKACGLSSIEMIMFPATSNRSGSVLNRLHGTDMYRDLFRRYNGREQNGVRIRMKLVLDRFLKGFKEISDLVRAFRFPCLWNANLFIAADGFSICCNDQSVRNPMGNIAEHSIDQLMVAKENYWPKRTCIGCDQRPELTCGTPVAFLFGQAAKIRMTLAGKPLSERFAPAVGCRFPMGDPSATAGE